MDRDHQDLFLLSQRYASLLHRTAPNVQPSSSSSSSSSHQSYIDANVRAQVDADIKAAQDSGTAIPEAAHLAELKDIQDSLDRVKIMLASRKV